MEDIIAYYEEGIALPENALLLTFDDGYIDHYTVVFPILQENKMQGSFFIPGKTISQDLLLDVNKIHFILAVAPVKELYEEVIRHIDDIIKTSECELPSKEELLSKYAKEERFDCKEIVFIKRMLQTVLPDEIRNRIVDELFQKFVGVKESVFANELYMNMDQIKCMKRNGMFIGIHGYDHYWLGNLSSEQMRNDITKALEVMDEFIDCHRWVMNYPYGDYNEEVLKYVAAKGAVLGLTTKVAVADLDIYAPLELPRLDCNDFPPKSNAYKKIALSE